MMKVPDHTPKSTSHRRPGATPRRPALGGLSSSKSVLVRGLFLQSFSLRNSVEAVSTCKTQSSYRAYASIPAIITPSPSPTPFRGIRASGSACEFDAAAVMRTADGERVVVAEVTVELAETVELVADVVCFYETVL